MGEDAKQLSAVPLTAKQRAAQRKSWSIGEMMLEHPEMTRAEAELLYDKVVERERPMDRLANDGLPLGRRWWPNLWDRFWS